MVARSLFDIIVAGEPAGGLEERNDDSSSCTFYNAWGGEYVLETPEKDGAAAEAGLEGLRRGVALRVERKPYQELRKSGRRLLESKHGSV